MERNVGGVLPTTPRSVVRRVERQRVLTGRFWATYRQERLRQLTGVRQTLCPDNAHVSTVVCHLPLHTRFFSRQFCEHKLKHTNVDNDCFFGVCDQFFVSSCMCVKFSSQRTIVFDFTCTLLADVTHRCIWLKIARNKSFHIRQSFICLKGSSVELFWYLGAEIRQRAWWCDSWFLVSGGSEAGGIATRRGASRCAIRMLKRRPATSPAGNKFDEGTTPSLLPGLKAALPWMPSLSYIHTRAHYFRALDWKGARRNHKVTM